MTEKDLRVKGTIGRTKKAICAITMKSIFFVVTDIGQVLFSMMDIDFYT